MRYSYELTITGPGKPLAGPVFADWILSDKLISIGKLVGLASSRLWLGLAD